MSSRNGSCRTSRALSTESPFSFSQSSFSSGVIRIARRFANRLQKITDPVALVACDHIEIIPSRLP